MAIKAAVKKVAGLTAAIAAMAVMVPSQAFADPDDLPYGPDTCIDGLRWREARQGDTVCVTPAFRDRTLAENAAPYANKVEASIDCLPGFVWRQAFDGDIICVTPEIRAANLDANAAAESNYARNLPGQDSGTDTVIFEVTGTGEVYAIVTDPDTGFVPDHTPLPWSATIELPADTTIYQVVATGRDTPGPGCRILINDVVVAEEPIGGDAHCIYTP